MGIYAENTTVSAERSRQEIERILERYGASAFSYGWKGQDQVVAFEAQGRRVKFVLRLPDPKDKKFTQTNHSWPKPRTAESAKKEWDQAVRQRWRALVLAIKAKLEAVESGIATFEDEFLAYIVIPGGATAGEWLKPQLEHAYKTGTVPQLLLGSGKGHD